MPQSLDIGQNADEGICDSRISGQSLINENCHNSGTSDDIDMTLRRITKRDKTNKETLKKFNDDNMPANCDVLCPLQSTPEA